MNNTFQKTHILAKNIEVGSIVSIYGEDWICCGSYKIYDGDFELDRIMLSSANQPSSLITFVHPTHQFTFDLGIYSDSEEFPF